MRSSIFWIQASSPREIVSNELDHESLDSAIQEVFPLYAERAYIVWGNNHIPLCYKYDLSLMMDEIIEMLEYLLSLERGEHVANWYSDTFSGQWKMKWENGTLTIEAIWHSVRNLTDSLIDLNESVTMPLSNFIAEWKRPLAIIYRALTRSGFDEQQVPDLSRLRKVCSLLEKEGALYQDW